MEFWNVSMHNVDHIAHFKHGVGGILIDGDGSLGVGPGGHIVPPTGQFRNNPNCTIEHSRYASCTTAVRRINVGVTRWTSPFWNTQDLMQYPYITVNDISDEELTLEWDKWKPKSKNLKYHYSAPKGPEACFEQAPRNQYSFMAAVGRRYLVVWNDENLIRATADIELNALKMRPDEHIVLQFTQRPPLYPDQEKHADDDRECR